MKKKMKMGRKDEEEEDFMGVNPLIDRLERLNSKIYGMHDK